MNDRPHTSATKEQEEAVDQAERRGIARGIEMSAVWLASKGQTALSDELRSAKVVETRRVNEQTAAD